MEFEDVPVILWERFVHEVHMWHMVQTAGGNSAANRASLCFFYGRTERLR